MRSLTLCSAGPVSLPPDNPTQAPVDEPPNTTAIPRPRTSVYPVPVPPRIIPQNPTVDPLPFFNVHTDSPLLSTRSKEHVTQAIRSSLAKSTVRRYSGTIKQFIRFCDQEQVPAHLRFPADEFLLCAFAASSLGRHARSTSRSRLSALKAWHVAHNMEWKGSPRLHYVLNGIHKRAPRSSTRPLRPPVNARMLTQLVEALDLSTPFDAAVAACAVTAFWGQCRLGELLPTSPAHPFPIPLPMRCDFKRSLRNPQSCLLHLPRTKTHYHGQDIVLVDQRPPINPISHLKNHLHVNRVPFDNFIFLYTSADDLLPLTKDLFLERCNAVWQPLGYPRTTGHCFRIGGTTELLIAGTPPDVVKATGRWSSDSFLRYWRSLDDIAPHYIRNLHHSKFGRRRQRSSTTRG